MIGVLLMCLSRVKIESDLITWGMWSAEFGNGYGNNGGYSTDGKMHCDHLAIGACGGGNKLEQFKEMPVDVAITDAMVSKLDTDHRILCSLMFVHKTSLKEESIRSRTSFAKRLFIKKYDKSEKQYKTAMSRLWGVLGVVLDTPKIPDFHPYHKIMALQVPAQSL